MNFPSKLADSLLSRVGIVNDRVYLEDSLDFSSTKLYWIFKHVFTLFLVFTLFQGSLFEVKQVYAQQVFPVQKSTAGKSSVYGNQQILGSGETDITRNNMGSVLLRAKSGRTTNQTFDMSHGAPIVWGRFLPEVGRGRIDVTYMEKNPVTGGVSLKTQLVGPNDFARTPVDKLQDNGIRQYYTNKAGDKFNPLEQFNQSKNNWGPGETSGYGTNQLYDISFGALTTAMGLVAKRYNANRGYAMFGHFWSRFDEGEEDCGFLDCCSKPWKELKAGVTGEWSLLSSVDSGSGNQMTYTIMGSGFSPAGNVGGSNNVSSPCITAHQIDPALSISYKENGSGGYDQFGTATRENEFDRDACTVRSSMSLSSPGMGNDFDSVNYQYFYHKEEYGCAMSFFLVLIIAIIVTIITFGAGAAVMAAAGAAAGLGAAAAGTAFAAAMGVGVAGLGTAVVAGLVAGAIMAGVHLAQGGSLNDQISMDAAGSMIMGAAIGGFFGGVMSGVDFSQITGSGPANNGVIANSTTSEMSEAVRAETLLRGGTEELATSNAQVVTDGFNSNPTGVQADWANRTGSMQGYVSSTSGGGVKLVVALPNSWGITLPYNTLDLIAAAGAVGQTISASANDPVGIVMKNNALANLVNAGATDDEALAMLNAGHMKTTSYVLPYGKITPAPRDNGDASEGGIWEYRPKVADCFMNSDIEDSLAVGDCQGSPAATWSVFSFNRQCDPSASSGVTSCNERFSQFSDILTMKMGAAEASQNQYIGSDGSAGTNCSSFNASGTCATADGAGVNMFLPKSGGARPVTRSQSKATSLNNASVQ